MNARIHRHAVAIALLVAAAGCRDSTGPMVTLRLQSVPAFSARVTSNTYRAGYTPAGWIAQYEVWVAIPPSDTANAGVVVPAAGPVYRITAGGVVRDTAANIAAGDSVRVWHSDTVVYGSMQAPPGAPAYFATQIEIVP